jgi:hypothetical protein
MPLHQQFVQRRQRTKLQRGLELVELTAEEGANTGRFHRLAASGQFLVPGACPVTAKRLTSSARVSPWLPLLISAVLWLLPGCSSLYDLVPGHKDAELRDRVQHDSFPTASQAMQTPAPASN